MVNIRTSNMLVWIVLLCQASFSLAQYLGYGGYAFHPRSFGHGYFVRLKAYPPLPKRPYTIADELKYGPRFNYGPYPEEVFSTTTVPASTVGPERLSSVSASVSVEASVMVSASGTTATTTTTTTTTPSPPDTTTDEDKNVADAPRFNCPAGQSLVNGMCRDED